LYGSLLAIAIFLCQRSRSQQLVAAAYVVALAWCFTFFWHYHFHGAGVTWGYAVVDASVAYVFWRRSTESAIAAPLFYVHYACVAVYFVTTLGDISDWWVFAILNRLFEAELFFLIWCATYRLARRRPNEKGAPTARPSQIS
jgi:hypothetical protein